MAKLKATGCRVGTQSITIFFSAQVDPGTAQTASNYTLFAPDAGLVNAAYTGTPQVLEDQRSVLLEWPATTFAAGQWVSITITGVNAATAGIDGITTEHVSGRVPSESGSIVNDVQDAISYPILTEEVAYRPSPVGIPTTGAGGIAGPGSSNLGQVALQAVSDVLGWKANPADPKGFVGALTQSFSLSDVEGHVEATWKPRSYAVQTDLGGGITGAQASLYMRAKEALDQSLTLLDGLYPLDPEADPEYVKALREMVRSQMTEIVKELGVVGLPSILRINTYFGILLGQNPANLTAGDVQLDPDQVQGTLGKLREEYGIQFRGNRFNNSVEDEQDITNFRVISDYMTSLMQSWIANRPFFLLKPEKSVPAFFGTQLVLISRQFNVIAETVNELRFALDSVFIGPNERQTLLLEFDDHSLPPMFLEDVLDEVDSFVKDEGPRLLRDGGKISVTNNILPVVDSLERMIKGAHHPRDQKRRVPDGFRTARVRHALDDLEKQLHDLVELTKQVEQEVPASEDKLTITGVDLPDGYYEGDVLMTLFGAAFDPDTEVKIYSTAPAAGLDITVTFYSAQRIDIAFDPTPLEQGWHDIEVTNATLESFTLQEAFYWNPGSGGGGSITIPPDGGGGHQGSSLRKAVLKSPPMSRKSRRVSFTTGGQPIVPTTPPSPSVPSQAATSASGAASTSARTSKSAPSSGAPQVASGSTAAPPQPTGATQQQFTALTKKYDEVQTGLTDLQASQDALSTKVDGLQKSIEDAMSKHLAETKSTQEGFFQEVRGWWDTLKSSDESKKNKP